MTPDYYAQLQWLLPAPPDFREQVQAALAASDDGAALRSLAQHGMNEAQLYQLGRAFCRARDGGRSWSGLRPLRLAVLSNGTVEHLSAALVATALRYGLDVRLHAVSYEQAYRAALGDDEGLRAFAPELVLLAFDYRALELGPGLGSAADEARTVAGCCAYLQAMCDGVRRHYGALCLVQTVALPPGAGFGSADRRIAGTPLRVLEAVNAQIAAAADAVLDVAALVACVGSGWWFDAAQYQRSKVPFALPLVPLYADHAGRVLGALQGKSRRVLVLDLDNTLWGGVVGDDGVHGIVIGNGSAVGEAHLALQRKALALRQRGVLLAVSSKNDDAQARRPFRELAAMLLKEDAFVAFRANWSDKAANLVAMAQELSLGLDSFVFFDDNPAERALVRRFLPEVAVPELPSDVSGYALVLDAAGYFESTALSEEDLRRADLYRNRAAIAELAPHDLDGYLRGLAMRLEVAPVQDSNRSRVVQLINKSNQFNLTTRRYSTAEVEAAEQDADQLCLALRLTDRLDDHGIISVLMCQRSGTALAVTLWVMSCRVIGRGVERAALQVLVDQARALGCSELRGQFLPSPRNQMVAQHYAKLGFTLALQADDGASDWVLPLAGWQPDAQPAIVLEGGSPAKLYSGADAP